MGVKKSKMMPLMIARNPGSSEFITLEVELPDHRKGVSLYSCERATDPMHAAAAFARQHSQFVSERFLVFTTGGTSFPLRIVGAFAEYPQQSILRVRIENGAVVVRMILDNLTALIHDHTKCGKDLLKEILKWARSLLWNVSMRHPILNKKVNDEARRLGGFGLVMKFLTWMHQAEDDICVGPIAETLLATLAYWTRTVDFTLQDEKLIDRGLCDVLVSTTFGRRMWEPFGLLPCVSSTEVSRRLAFLILYCILDASRKAREVFCQLWSTVKKRTQSKRLVLDPELSYFQLLNEATKDTTTQDYGYLRSLFIVVQQESKLVVDLITRLQHDNVHPKDSPSIAFLRNLCAQPPKLMYLTEAMCDCSIKASILAEVAKSEESPQLSTLRDELDKSANVNNVMIKRKLKVESDLRSLHSATCKLVDYFVKVEDDFISHSLRAVVRYGWDSIKWEGGYTALHFAAEFSSDTNLVELLGLLAPDINCRDASGLRPIDYARKADQQSNVRVFEELHQRQTEDSYAENALEHALIQTQNNEVVLPDDMGPTLHRAMETVLQLGWKEIVWPKGFTALHLAAASGHLRACRMLIEFGGEDVLQDISRIDDTGRRAIDCAVENNHLDVVQYFKDKGFDASVNTEKHGVQLAPCDLPSPNVLEQRREEKRKMLRVRNARSTFVFNDVPPEVTPEMQKICADVLAGSHANKFPLHAAAKVNDVSAMYILCEHGIQDKGDANGKTARQLAFELGNDACLAVLDEVRASDSTSNAHDGFDTRESISIENNRPAICCTTTSAYSERSLGGSMKFERELAQARWQLRRLRNKANDQFEEANRMLRAKLANVTGQLETGKNGAEIGPLSQEQVAEWLHLQDSRLYDAQKLALKLQESSLSGGLNLSPDDAACAVEQIVWAKSPAACVGRAVCSKCRSDAPDEQDTPASGGNVPPVRGGREGPSAPDVKNKGPPKGKGKGPPAPKGKGKGPPSPGGKEKGPGTGGKGPVTGGKGLGPADGGDCAEKQDTFRPPKPMKPLWWNKLTVAEMKGTQNAWSEIEAAHHAFSKLLQNELQSEFVNRFGKVVTRRRSDDTAKKDCKPPKNEPPRKEVLRVITDPQLIVGREAAVKHLPSPQTVAKAVLELDNDVLPPSLLEMVELNCCPTPEQVVLMEMLRKQSPLAPWALPEQYMSELVSHVPMHRERVQCWRFIRSVHEQFIYLDESLERFLKVIDCMRHSLVLQAFLAMALGSGNYLNSGTSRGMADGFGLVETMPKLETVKDNIKAGKNLVNFLMEAFFEKFGKSGFVEASQFGKDLIHLLNNVRRRVQRDPDGTERLEKSVVVSIEDFDGMVRQLHEDFNKKDAILQMMLLNIQDPADPIRSGCSMDFKSAKQKLMELSLKKQQCRDKFAELQHYFALSSSVTSSDLVLLWDNLLIPGDLIINRTAKEKKHMALLFCSGNAVDHCAMERLWGLRRRRKRSDATLSND